MATNSIETLASEVFLQILQHIDSQHDLSHFSQASKQLYDLVTPKLYHSWSYHGLTNPKESLRQFLRTILWRKDLAALVEEVDLREWGNEYSDCPRVEDWSGDDGWGKIWWKEGEPEKDMSNEEREEEVRKCQERWDEEMANMDDDEEDINWVPEIAEDEGEDGSSKSGNEDGDEDDDSIQETEIEPSEVEDLRALTKTSFSSTTDFLRAAALAMGLDDDVLIGYNYTTDPQAGRDENILMALLLSKLLNLRTLWMVMPEEQFDPPDAMRLLKDRFIEDGNLMFGKLETLIVCSALHIGSKGHREYDLAFHSILPYLGLPSLKTLKTLSLDVCCDDWTLTDLYPPPNIPSLVRTSDLTSLTLDDCFLTTPKLLFLLSIPRSLHHLRITQLNSGSWSEMTHPHPLFLVLKQHKRTLKNLELDIRCSQGGPNRNPIMIYFDPEYYGNWIQQFKDLFPTMGTPVLNEKMAFVGSLAEFEVLEKVVVDYEGLVGKETRSANADKGEPVLIHDVLPKNLVSLTLLSNTTPIPDEMRPAPTTLLSDYLKRHLELLVQNIGPQSNLQKLKSIDLQICSDTLYVDSVKWCDGIKTSFEAKGVNFNTVMIGNPLNLSGERYFKQQLEVRNPGRDW